MNILIPQHLPNFPITQRRLIFTHLPRNFRVRTLLRQELLSCHPPHCNCIIRRIKHLKSQPALLNRQITNLSQIPGIDITPGISLTRSRVGEKGGEVFGVFVRLYHVSDSEGVDVVLEAAGERACCFLAADLGECIPRYVLEAVVM
jgi:hypothetical protein